MRIEFTEDSVRGLSKAMGKPDRPFKSKPNWREAFEQVLAKGGSRAIPCNFCVIINKIYGEDKETKCPHCPLFCVEHGNEEYCFVFMDCGGMDNSERRAICRHVLATVKDFTDRDEIRARIAEMLDDPEKFLGKAEPEKPEWIECGVHFDEPYCNEGAAGPNGFLYPRLRYFAKGKLAGEWQTRAGFQTEADGQLFIDALPEEEK